MEEALGEVQIFHNGQEMAYLSINGRVREQTYTYYNYRSEDGSTRQIPAYCINPNTAGVPQTVPAGTSIKYLADQKSNDPKVFGIVASGYPHRSLEDLGLSSVDEGYYATKMALWCHILPNWDISDLTVNPAADQAAAQRVLAADDREICCHGCFLTELNNATINPRAMNAPGARTNTRDP